MDTHAKNQSVVGDDRLIMQHNVFVTSVNVDHSGIDDPDSAFKHQLPQLFSGVTGGVSLQIFSLLHEMVVREATWSYQDNAGELQIADGQKGLNEGDAGVTGAYDHNSGILHNLCL